MYTFGYGGHGALGNDAFRDELSPFLVASLRSHGGTLLVECGFDHTVAITGDLKARGAPPAVKLGAATLCHVRVRGAAATPTADVPSPS